MRARVASALSLCCCIAAACSPTSAVTPIPQASGGGGGALVSSGAGSGGVIGPGTGGSGNGGTQLATGGAGVGGTPSSGGITSTTGGLVGQGGVSATGGSAGTVSTTGGLPSGGSSGAKSSGGQGGTGGVGGTVGSGGGGQGSGGTSAGCPRACGPTYDQFFDNNKLATLRITIDPANAGSNWLDTLWQKWKHCTPFTWVPVTMQYESPDGLGNVTLPNVGMRLRGSMMRGTNQLQGFKLDVQALDTPGAAGKRRFADLNRINTLSVEADPSHMVQCAAYKAMRDSGIPAPRCNHLKVYVNGTYYGLMENIEQVNKGYARRHFGTNQGSLYGGSPSMGDCATGGFKDSQALLTYSGDTFSSYSTQYQLTHATASEAEQNLIPMLKCGAEADDNTFKTCIAQWIDVDEWLKEIAAESIMPSLEALIGYYRNYYLYFKADTTSSHGGRFVIWSWDLDNSFQLQKCNTSTCDVLTGVSSYYGIKPRAKLITRLTTLFRAQYCTAMKNFISTGFKSSSITAMGAIIQPGFAGDATATASDITTIKNFVDTRATAVQSQITAACQ
jgi:spore coat protein CotH